MTNVQEHTDTFELLDILLSNASEVKCESRHAITTCSVKVTHRVVWCRGTANLCENATTRVRNGMLRNICKGCKNPVQDCWRIYPI